MLIGVVKLKTTMVSEEPKDEKEVRILNGVVQLVPGQGLLYEADPRHAEIAIKEVSNTSGGQGNTAGSFGSSYEPTRQKTWCPALLAKPV